MPLKIRNVDDDNLELWDKYVKIRADSTFVDTIAWRTLTENIYDLNNYWYMVENNDKIEGAMALTLSSHPIFGRYLATAPFANHGGFYADAADVRRVLINKATELKSELKAKYVVIRHDNHRLPCPGGWVSDIKYATFRLTLSKDPQELMSDHFQAKDRSQIKKSLTNGLTASFGGIDLLDTFWHVIIRAMSELGSPYHSKYYLEILLRTFKTNAELVIIRDNTGDPAGAALLIYHNKNAILLHANILSKYRALGCGDFLYWSVIEHCCRRGFSTLDMGRSLINSGNEKYKMKFRPHRILLSYWYNLSPGVAMPDLNQENSKFKYAIRAWKSMPLWVNQIIGPKLISGIL